MTFPLEEFRAGASIRRDCWHISQGPIHARPFRDSACRVLGHVIEGKITGCLDADELFADDWTIIPDPKEPMNAAD